MSFSCTEHTFHINLIRADLEANDLIDHPPVISAVFLNEDLFRGR